MPPIPPHFDLETCLKSFLPRHLAVSSSSNACWRLPPAAWITPVQMLRVCVCVCSSCWILTYGYAVDRDFFLPSLLITVFFVFFLLFILCHWVHLLAYSDVCASVPASSWGRTYLKPAKALQLCDRGKRARDGVRANEARWQFLKCQLSAWQWRQVSILRDILHGRLSAICE